MRLGWRLLLGGFVIALVAVPVRAEEPEASQPPRTSGPLVGVPIPCEDNGPAGQNESKGQTCSWTYSLASADADIANDYWAYWFQMEIDPGPGWCAKQLSFEMEAPGDGDIISAAPFEGRRIRKRSIATNELVIDGAGTAVVPGTIAQDVTDAPGRVRVSVDEERYSYEWRGNSRDKVMIAIGVELSSPTLPSELLTTWSEGHGAGMGTCRPLRVLVTSR